MDFEVSQRVDPDEWQELADRSAEATFFHTPPWYEAFARTYPFMRLATRRFVFEDGQVVIFPLLEVRSGKGLVRTYQSGPAGCYGGWISERALAPERAVTVAGQLASDLPCLQWRLNPFAEGLAGLSGLAGLACCEDSTEVLNLRDFDCEQSLRAHYAHSARKQIKKAEREGLIVRPAESDDDWRNYFALYERTLARWGDQASSRYPAQLFDNLRGLGGERVVLWLVERADQLLGGNLNFTQGRHCVEWHAVFEPDARQWGARNFLVHHVIRDAWQRGFERYDFNPSGGNQGTRDFKRRHGTHSLRADVLTQERFSPAAALVGFLKRAADGPRSA